MNKDGIPDLLGAQGGGSSYSLSWISGYVVEEIPENSRIPTARPTMPCSIQRERSWTSMQETSGRPLPEPMG